MNNLYRNRSYFLQKYLDIIIKYFNLGIRYSLYFNDNSLNYLLNDELKYFNQTLNKNIIILQGPISDIEYLKTTINVYANTGYFDEIIVSTWEDERNIKKIQNLDNGVILKILLNEKPSYPGISNINYQIISTVNALKYIKQKYTSCNIIKSRTDQRLLSCDLTFFLHDISISFPIRVNSIKNRIVICSFNTFKYRPYSISDMFMYGTIDDLLIFWDQSLDTNKIELDEIIKPRTMTSWSKLTLAEVYLVINFMNKINYQPNFSIENYWTFLNDYFIVIDPEMIGLEWNKYTFNNKMGNINQYNLRERFYHFTDWIIFQNNHSNINYNYLETKMNFHENIKIQKN